MSQRVLEPNVFCNHGLADTSEWLLLWPWDPKLDNFRIGEHTFSEGAGGLKPKTVYRSTFNIGKVEVHHVGGVADVVLGLVGNP